MNTRMLLAGIAAATLLAAPALAAPPATTPAPVTAPAKVVPVKVEAKGTKTETLYMRAQEKLKADHGYTGAVDGKRSTAFVKALESFQKEHKIKTSGRLDSETQKALGI